MFFFRMEILHKPLQQKRTEIRECIDPVFVTDVIGRKFESIAYIRIFFRVDQRLHRLCFAAACLYFYWDQCCDTHFYFVCELPIV